MEALTRQEYPAMLARLQPAAAVSKFNERVKRIGKVNTEIADWLQERRKIEEAYVAGLKKLVRKPMQEVGGDLGIFDAPWKKILESTEEIASSHYTLSQRIETDVEDPLRNFSTTNREMQQMSTVAGNLSHMAKELNDAQEKSDKLTKKGGKASTQKVEQASSKLQTAEQQWDSQAPFIFENLQALDERRLNHLRDVLTQFQTHQADQVERERKTIEQTVSTILEIDTTQEIKNWSEQTVAGKPITERRARALSISESTATPSPSIPPASTMPPPPTPPTAPSFSEKDNQSERSSKKEKDSLKSRFGTMLGSRRKSIHGGFARAPSPSKAGFAQFGRSSGSQDGRPSPSPRASSGNLREGGSSRDNRLSSLAESPPVLSPASPTGRTNGVTAESSNISDNFTANGMTSSGLTDLSDVQPPPGPPPSHLKQGETDSDGFTIPAPRLDPISQAENEAHEGSEPQFKLDIRKEPILEQDDDAQAALSNVANTLRSSQAITPNRKTGTVRGRRDVRNTMFVPTGSGFNALDIGAQLHSQSQSQEPMPPPSPGVPAGRAAALAALSSNEHHSAPSISDSTSIRSSHSLTNNPIAKHAEMQEPGLNASIIETVNATFEEGVVKSAKVSGEIALTYNKPSGEETLPETETIRINNFPLLEVIGPNRTFIHPLSADKTDEYTVNLSSILSKPSAAFTYRIHNEDNSVLASQTPLNLKVAWKSQADKLGLLLDYTNATSSPLTFNNLTLVAHYTGNKANGCQTKPTGTHLKERSLVYYRLGDVTLAPGEPHRVICRLNGEGIEPGHVDARWEVKGGLTLDPSVAISLSRLEDTGKGKEKEVDPFADEGSPAGKWTEVPLGRKIVGGKYEAR